MEKQNTTATTECPDDCDCACDGGRCTCECDEGCTCHVYVAPELDDDEPQQPGAGKWDDN